MNLPAEVLEAAIAATQTAFEELCQTPVFASEPGAEPASETIAATIHLKRSVPGSLTLAFPRIVLEVLATRYLPEEASAPELLADAAGEFANVIAGQMKTILKGTPYHFHLSTPQIAWNTVSESGPPTAAIPFDTDSGRFTLRVHLPPCDDPDAAPHTA